MSQNTPRGPIRIGSIVPDFNAETTQGKINFYEQIAGHWAIVFAFPDDFTPVATTELVIFSEMQGEFAKRGVRLFALSTNNTMKKAGDFEPHQNWVRDINEISNAELQFPIISDEDGSISLAFHVLEGKDANAVKSDDGVGDGLAFKSRTVFIIDKEKRFRLIFNYPAAVGLNAAEVLRVVDCLQTAARADVRTPANWIPGGDVVIPPTVSDAEAKKKFPGYMTVKPYLRVYTLPIEATSVEVIKDITEQETEKFLTVDA